MSKKLFCILGESMVGKDTITKEVCKRLNLRPVCSYATRPIRENETEGVEHYFISDEQMGELLKTEQIVAYTIIEDKSTGVKGYEYCATLDELLKSDIYQIDPLGLESLCKQLKHFCISKEDIIIIPILIKCDYNLRLERLRNSNRGEGALKEFEDRSANERKQFEDFYNNKDLFYFEVINEGELEQAIEEVCSIITECNK